VNTIGFLPTSEKLATVAAPCDRFSLVRVEDGKVVFASKAGPKIKTSPSDTNETVQLADFSTFTTIGRYQLEVPGLGRSATFVIATDVWNVPFQVVTRAFYLWRCGCAVRGDWDGLVFSHGACHLEDGWLDQLGSGHERRVGTGGWHDAGDYNKYVVNAGVSVGLMLHAWEQFGEALRGVKLQLPESSNGTPDLLNEIRWELEWLFTMQEADGRVDHKLSALAFSYWGKPDADQSPRYFSPWSSTATADFVAMLAAAARCYRPYDPAFSERCLKAAQRSWAFLVTYPENIDADQHAFKTGQYRANDSTHRFWAAAELWETTGDDAYLREFERRAATTEFSFNGPSWGEVNDLALGTYLTSKHPAPRDHALVSRVRANLFSRASEIVATAKSNGYSRALGDQPNTWFWGDNGAVAAQTYLLHLADKLQPDPRYRETALHSLAFLFGRNFHGRSYVTGLGANPPRHPHDRRGEPAWPGYLVGGGWPDGKSWVDELGNYRVNEIAINWNASLVYALAAFVQVSDDHHVEKAP
jgi:endoglucanase